MMRGDSLFTWDKFNDNEEIRSQAMQSAAEGGPNSGFEIPSTDFFKQPELANQFPEMKDDIDLIISTESYINRLVDFEKRMKKAKGMSRGMAYELVELIPSLESHVKPNHFTEDISGVGYQPSLESISTQMWVVIAAAAAFLVAIIYKFINWLFGDGNGSSGGSGGGTLDKAEQGIKESEKKVEQQERALERTVSKIRAVRGKEVSIHLPRAISHEKIRNSSLPQSVQDQIIQEIPDLLDSTKIDPESKRAHFLKINLSEALLGFEGGQQVLEYMRKPSRYARIVFAQTRGEAMNLVTASFEGFNSYSKIMASELDALEEAFAAGKEMMSAFTSGNPVPSQAWDKERTGLLSLASISDERPASFKIGSHTYLTAGGWATDLKAKIHEEGSQETNFNDLEELLSGYQIGVRRLKEVNWRGMIVFIELLKKSQPALQKLEAMAKGLQKTSARDPSRPERKTQAESIIRLQRVLTENYAGLMRVYAEISRVYTEVTKNAAEVVNTLRKNAAGLVALYNSQGEMVPPSLEELLDDLSHLSKETKEAVVNQHMLPFVSVKHLKVSFGGSDEEDDDRPSITMSTEEAANALKIVTGQKKDEE